MVLNGLLRKDAYFALTLSVGDDKAFNKESSVQYEEEYPNVESSLICIISTQESKS